MPLLPQPDTLSPGSLQLLYTTGVLEHITSANFLADVVVADVSTIRTEAEAFAALVADLLPNTCFISSWRIADPANVSLYEEAFADPIVGTRTIASGEVPSQSATGALTGKGRPAVGLAQGQTRTTIFLASFDGANWPDNRQALDAGGTDFAPLREFLNTSDVVGADNYGSKATYRNYWCPQINTHYQKTYGL